MDVISSSGVLAGTEGPRLVGPAVLDIWTVIIAGVVRVQVAPAPPLVGLGAVPPGAVHLARTLAIRGWRRNCSSRSVAYSAFWAVYTFCWSRSCGSYSWRVAEYVIGAEWIGVVSRDCLTWTNGRR